MSNDGCDLGWLCAEGSSYELGEALGRQGRSAVHAHLLGSSLWRDVTAPAHASRVRRMADETAQRFPRIWRELQGLAAGLELPLEQVVAWNCRGDLFAAAPDGCTTIQLPGPVIRIAHNEDGLPSFRGHCFIAELRPEGQHGFMSFCYPGSLPGHSFAVTSAGLVQAVNNLRFMRVAAQVPRIVLGRATLTADTLDSAVAILDEAPPSGGFHVSLAASGDPRLLSVEFGAGEASVQEIITPSVHANHALHHTTGLTQQIITDSSRDRQARGERLLRERGAEALEILRDTSGDCLPIRRDAPDDPDGENTLATAIFDVGPQGADWSIYDRVSERPAYWRKTAPA